MPIQSFAGVQSLFLEPGEDRNGTVATSIPGVTASQPVPQRPTSFLVGTPGTAASGNAASFSAMTQRHAYAGNVGKAGTTPRWILTSDLWREQDRALVLHAGPSSAQWTLALRAAEEPISSGNSRFAKARGTSRNNFQGSAITYFDVPRVSLSFQTGNIMPIPVEFTSGGGDVLPAYGLQDFYYFLQIINQPPLMPEGPDEGSHNYVWCFYTSLHFPTLVLKGYFDPQGITWTDSAEAPTTLEWTADLSVHDMSPSFLSAGSGADNLLRSYNDIKFL